MNSTLRRESKGVSILMVRRSRQPLDRSELVDE
jgi:hypothetical protein